MNSDVNGCSTCPIGQEHYEKCKMPSNRKINGIQYDYRDTDGELFSTVAINLFVARQKKANWLVAKLVKEYWTDLTKSTPKDWIAGERLTEEEKDLFMDAVSVKPIKLDTVTYYELRDANGSSSYRPDGASPYANQHAIRMKMYNEHKILQSEIYGLDQVRQHVDAMRKPTGSEFDEFWKNKAFKIVKITTTVEEIETL